MSIESLLKDNDCTIMSSRTAENGNKVYAIDTSQSNSYTLDYMIIIIPLLKDLSTDIMYAYFTDITDLFYFFDFSS